MNWLLSLAPRRPMLTLTVAGILAAISLLAVLRLKPETSLDAMLSPNDPATIAMTRVMTAFPVTEEMLVLASVPGAQPIDRAKLLAFAERLSRELVKEQRRVAAVHDRPTEQSRQFVEKIVAPAGLLYLSDDELAEAKRRLTPEAMAEQFRRNESMLAAPGPAVGGLAKAILRDPLRLHELLGGRLNQMLPASASSSDGFFSPDGRAVLVRIEGTRPPSDLEFSQALTQRVTAIAEAMNVEHLDLRITGSYAIAAYNSARIRADAIWDTVTSVLFLAGLFVVLYRRPVWTFVVAFTPIAIGILCGFGMYALFSDTITPLAAVIGGALGGIGIDYSTHMLAHHHPGGSPVKMVQRLAAPLLAACVTSVIGFAVIGWSPVRLLRDFAVVGSLSLIGAFVAGLTILPALLSLRQTNAMPRLRLTQVAWRQPRRTLTIASIVLVPVIFIAFAGRMPGLDQDVHNLHPRPNPPLDAQLEVSQRMGLGGGSIVVHVRADSPDKLIARCHEVQARLASPASRNAGVQSVFGPASLLPNPAIAHARGQSFTDRDIEQALAAFDRTVEQSGFDAKAYVPYRSVLVRLLRPDHIPGTGDLRQYPELATTVLPRDSAANDALVHLTFVHPPETRQEIERTTVALNDILRGIDGVTLTGMSVISQQTLATVQRDLPRVALLAFGGVAVYLAVHYRSLKLAILAMVPTAVSLVLLLAVMRVASIELNMVNLVMVPLLLGINIDFGIFAADALRGCEGDSLHEHFCASLAAMLVCASTATIGFGSLAFTSVPAVQSLGWLMNVGIAGCTLGAIFVLWPIIILMARRRGIQ